MAAPYEVVGGSRTIKVCSSVPEWIFCHHSASLQERDPEAKELIMAFTIPEKT